MRKKAERLADKEERFYYCPYCKNNFKRLVGSQTGAGKKPVSSQIKCPLCGNFLKTWDK